MESDVMSNNDTTRDDAVSADPLDGILPPLTGEWTYKGADLAWQILYRWGDKFAAVPEIARLFLRSDGTLHPLARAINASRDAALREAREEIAFWRRDATARLQMNIWLHRGCEQRGEDHRAADVRLSMRATLAALDAADSKDWHERCCLCGEFLFPEQPYSMVAMGDPDDIDRAHSSCVGDVGQSDQNEDASIVAQAKTILSGE